jgi:iron complex outermembrane receptor protein
MPGMMSLVNRSPAFKKSPASKVGTTPKTMRERSTQKDASYGTIAVLVTTIALLSTGRSREPDLSQADSPVELEPMVVTTTGSILPQSEAATSLPVSTYTEERIRATGATTVTQFLQTIPQNTGARFRENVSTGLSFTPGAAAISLRGLNVNATLVLLNGRRLAPFPFAQNGTDAFVDINSIPLAAVERIEILREGASAIYGSDAIAGVVNIITKQNFEGTEIFTQYGNTTRADDMAQKRASLVSGLTARDGRFRLLISADYYQQNPLANVDREFSRTLDHRRQSGTDQRSVRPNPGTFFTPQGPLRPPSGTNGVGLTPEDFRPGTTASGSFVNRYNFNSRSELIPYSERIGHFGTVEYDLSNYLTLFGEALYNETRTKERAAPTPIDSADDLTVGPANPYNPFGTRIGLLYRLVDFDNRLTLTNSEQFRYVGGMKVKNLPNNWQIEIAGMASENKVTSRGVNYASKMRAQEALDSADPDNALNPFAEGPGFQRSKVLDRLRVQTYLVGRSELRSADIRASGDLFSLPAGPVGLGLGLEYREEELSVSPDPRSRLGDIVGTGGVTAEGARSSKGAYFQADVPLASPEWTIPGIYALNFVIAGRYEEFTDFGDVFKPKFSLRYKPVEPLTLRASYQEGFRAASLSQLFLGDVVSFEAVVDPQRPGQGTVDTKTITRGNSRLKPETSYSYSAGFVLDVPGVEGVSVTADFYRIEQRNLIDAPSAQFVLDNPGFSAGATLERNSNGDLILINTPFSNFGQVVVDGVDLEVDYRLPWQQWGSWGVRWAGAYVNSFEQTGLPGSPNLERIRTFQYPAFRSRGSVDWKLGGLGAEIALNYTSGYEDIGLEPRREREIEGWATIDMQLTYEFNAPKIEAVEAGKSATHKAAKELLPIAAGATWWQKLLDGTKLTVGVNNVADEDPPFANLFEGYDTATADPSGRFYYVALRKRF